MVHLFVQGADLDEVFADTVRIPRDHRGNINNGDVVLIYHHGRYVFAIARGYRQPSARVIAMDEFTQRKLGVNVGDQISTAAIGKATWWQKVAWYLFAANPAVHVPAWLAVISIGVGGVGLILGVVSLFR